MKFIYSIVCAFCILSVSVSEAQDTCITGNCENGVGVLECSCGYTYEGEFMNGEKVYGTMIKEDLTYIGPFDKGMAHGEGLMVYLDSSYYKGDFDASEMSGHGQLYLAHDLIYEGGFYQNDFSGWGVINYDSTSGDERIWMVGKFKEGTVNGWSAMQMRDSSIFIGQQKNGLYFGEVIIIKEGSVEVQILKKGKVKKEGLTIDDIDQGQLNITGNKITLEGEDGAFKISIDLLNRTFDFIDVEGDVKLSFILEKWV